MTAENKPKPHSIQRVVGIIGMLGCMLFAFLGGRFVAATEHAAKPSQETIDYRMVMLALDSGWKATWTGGLMPAADRSDEPGQNACWRVPLYDIVTEDRPLRAWRCQQYNGDVTYNWMLEEE